MPISGYCRPTPLLHIPLVTLGQGPFAGWFTGDYVKVAVHWPEDERGHARSAPCEGAACALCHRWGEQSWKWHYCVPAVRLLPRPAGQLVSRREQQLSDADRMARFDAMPPDEQRALLAEAAARLCDVRIPAEAAQTPLMVALRERIGAPRFDLWFNGKASIAESADEMTVTVGNTFSSDWLSKTFAAELRELAGERRVRFQIAQASADLSPEVLRDAAARIMKTEAAAADNEVRQAVVLDLTEGAIADLARRLGDQPWRGVKAKLRWARSHRRTEVQLLDEPTPADLAVAPPLPAYFAARWRYPADRVTAALDEFAETIVRFGVSEHAPQLRLADGA